MGNPIYDRADELIDTLMQAHTISAKTRAIIVVPARITKPWFASLKTNPLFKLVGVYLTGTDMFEGANKENPLSTKNRTKLRGCTEMITIWEMNSDEAPYETISFDDIPSFKGNLIDILATIKSDHTNQVAQPKSNLTVVADQLNEQNSHQTCEPKMREKKSATKSNQKIRKATRQGLAFEKVSDCDWCGKPQKKKRVTDHEPFCRRIPCQWCKKNCSRVAVAKHESKCKEGPACKCSCGKKFAQPCNKVKHSLKFGCSWFSQLSHFPLKQVYTRKCFLFFFQLGYGLFVF